MNEIMEKEKNARLEAEKTAEKVRKENDVLQEFKRQKDLELEEAKENKTGFWGNTAVFYKTRIGASIAKLGCALVEVVVTIVDEALNLPAPTSITLTPNAPSMLIKSSFDPPKFTFLD